MGVADGIGAVVLGDQQVIPLEGDAFLASAGEPPFFEESSVGPHGSEEVARIPNGIEYLVGGVIMQTG